MKKLEAIPVTAYRADGFIKNYQKLVKDTVIPYQHEVLFDRIEGIEKSHVGQNFENAGRVLRGEDPADGFYGMVFQDSDAAKWLEAVAYSLANTPDSKLEQDADELIALIEAAQDTDGYLNTYYTIKDKDKRWTNLLEGHELYCSGHMMEAAVAYYEATGKDTLLKVMLRNMEHIYDVFITNGHPGYPGHPEVELALLKLYRATGNPHALELARHFIDVRGVDSEYYKKERASRDWTVWGSDGRDPYYQQSAMPVRELSVATGHAVRAGYLFTAMADLAATDNDDALQDACLRLWDNITTKQLYVTGGIGQTVNGEAFTKDYDLPSDTAYAETCASIALMMFASRMLEIAPKSDYADVMEQAFYNTVLAGMQLDGKRFFYVNPLEVVPGISGEVNTQRHDLPERPGWYTCACCPPNVARTITSFGRYAYGENADTAFCHLFASGEIAFANGLKLQCKTDYPYDFNIFYKVSGAGKLAIRIPNWSKKNVLTLNNAKATAELKDGYAYLTVSDGDEICLTLDSAPRMIFANPRVPRLTGKVAIARGPLVYCFEGNDNAGDILSLRVKTFSDMKITEPIPAINATGIQLSATRIAKTESLYSTTPPTEIPTEAIAIPYYTWGNRGKNQMRVWMDYEK